MMEERLRVVAEARTWINTPYHHKGSVKGAGVDCALFVLQSFVGAGLVEPFDPGSYQRDWHLHRGEERYLDVVTRYSREVGTGADPVRDRPEGFHPEVGDMLMWRVGRTFSHGAIVTDWPFVVHASLIAERVEEIDVRTSYLAPLPMRVFSFWEAK